MGTTASHRIRGNHSDRPQSLDGLAERLQSYRLDSVIVGQQKIDV
jgi:hypothetical protein